MKKYTLTHSLLTFVSLIFVFLIACTAPSKPEYIRFKKDKIRRVNKKWEITGKVIYMNNNSFGGNVKACDIDVYVNDVLATHISQTVKVTINAQEEFAIPLTCIIDSKKIRKENKGFLKGVVKGLLDKNINLRYKGNFVVDLMGKGVKIPFEYEEQVGFGVNYE